MAIYIDIIARLNQRQVIKQGEELRRYMASLEEDLSDARLRTARGETRQLVKLDNDLARTRNKAINTTDDLTNARLRLAAADQRVLDLSRARAADQEAQKKLDENRISAAKEQAAAEQDLVYKLQAEDQALRSNELATRTLNEEKKAYTKNLRDVAKITDKNRGKFIRLSMATNRLRRDTESLHAANVTVLQDNAKITKSVQVLSDATQKTAIERDKYNDVLLTKNPARIKAQGRVVQNALIAEGRKAELLSSQIVELVQQRQDHDSVIAQNEKSLRGLATAGMYSVMANEALRSANRDVIEQNITLTRQFDRVGATTLKVTKEFRKYHEMSQDVSVDSDALATQVEKVKESFAAQQVAVRDSGAALAAYEAQQERAFEGQMRRDEAERLRERDRIRRRIPSPGQYVARNIGALTPLGTLSPTALLPVAAIAATVAEAVVTASQALALLPAAATAAAAGIGTLVIGMKGFGDALSSMGDPKKFAEALYTLSPNAQQAALRIQQLVDGPLGDLKRATQDALFADVGLTIQKLTQVLGPAVQRMTTSIATSFNQMFTGISFQLMTPEMSARVATITENISEMFARMIPGITAFSNAFMKIAETGSGFLPGLANSFTGLMQSFDNFITRAQNDGSLQNFIQKGIDAVKVLSKFLLEFGKDIYEVFGNKSPEEFMTTLESLKGLVIGLFEIFRAFAKVLDALSPIIMEVVNDIGGWENALIGLLSVWGVVKVAGLVKFAKELSGAFGKVGPAAVAASRGVGALGTAAAITAGAGATTAAAQKSAATTAATFAAGGTAAGKGFGAKLMSGIMKLGWVGLGLYIGKQIGDALDQSLLEKSAQNYPNPQGYLDEVQEYRDRNFLPEWTGIAWIEGLIRNILTDTPGPGRDPNGPAFQPPVGELGELGKPYTEVPDPNLGMPPWLNDLLNGPGSGDLPLPNVPLDENGKALTDSEILDKYRGELPRESYAVDPFVDPITGQKLNPMLPIGPNGLPEYPAGGVPGTPSIQGPVMPQYNSFGQMTGYGANMVDPAEVFDAQLAVVDRGHDLEEAKKDLLAGQKAGILSAEEINDLERKVFDGKLSLHKALVQLGKAQTGDVEKLKNTTNDMASALGDFGSAIDSDFGISKGLAGIAENITKFVAGLAFAPAFGAMRGAQAALGFPGGEGTGYGLAGAAAVSRGYYKGGPMDPNAQQPGSGYNPSAYTPTYAAEAASYSQPVGPQTAGVGYGSGPGKVQKGDIKGVNLSTIPVAAQQYANNCIDAAAQIILSANGVQLTQDQIEQTIKRGGSIDSLASGLNKLDPTGGYVPIPASGGSPDALLASVQDSINKGNGSVLNVAPGSSIGGQNFPAGHFIAVTGYDPTTGRINLSDTARGTMYSVTPGEAFQASKGRGLVAGRGVAQGPGARPQPQTTPINGPYPVSLPRFATGGEVPIMAHSGEHVLTREDVAALGGQAGVYNFRRSLHSYELGGGIPRTPFSPDPFDPSNNVGIPMPTRPTSPKDVTAPTDLGSLLGVGDTPPPVAPPPPPVVPAPVVPVVPEVPAVPAVPAPAVLPETVLPPGMETPGAVIGAQVEAPAGYGGGFEFTGGGLAGLAQQGLMMAATSGAAMGGGGGGGAAGAIASLGMETAIKLAQRGIEYGAQVAGIATQGALETFLPAGGSELASNNWLTRIVGGVVGAAPAMANLAGGAGASNQSTLPGVGAPTPEQIAAQGMDPNRAQHTGAGAPAGPYTGVNIQNYVVTGAEDRAGQDLARYQPMPGAR